MTHDSTGEPLDELRTWLIETVADYLEADATAVSATASLAEFGLDSVHALALCGEIEDRLGVIVEPTLLWDYTSIEELARYLSGLPGAVSGVLP